MLKTIKGKFNMINIVLESLWEVGREEGRIIPLHSHNYYELVYYSKGGGKTDIGNKGYKFFQNTFVVIPPGTEHNEIHFSEAEVICLGFSGVSGFTDIFYSDNSGKIYSVLKDALKEISEQKFGFQEIVTAKLTELYYKIKRIEPQKPTATKSFEYIINYLNENYHEKIKLSSCAEQLHLSYDYFQHKFKEITGLSPQNYLLEQRLKASKELIKKGLSCTETAYRCGFSTLAQFSMLFKKRFGLSPKMYK